MAFDVKSFRRALGTFATGVAVMTVAGRDGASDVGITVNSFTSVSLNPPLILVCLDRASRHAARFVTGEEFVVNVLNQEQGATSIHFAMSATQETWTGLAVTRTAAGTPVIGDCLAHLTCRLVAVHEGGDHDILVARVEELEWRRDGHPLLYFRGCYGRLGDIFVPSADR